MRARARIFSLVIYSLLITCKIFFLAKYVFVCKSFNGYTVDRNHNDHVLTTSWVFLAWQINDPALVLAAVHTSLRPERSASRESAVRHGPHQRHPQRQLPHLRQPARRRHHLPDHRALHQYLHRRRYRQRPCGEQ